jgi:sirohydrochlorin cobaltochelatase
LARVSVTEPERLLESLLASERTFIGQIEIRCIDDVFALSHRDDVDRRDLRDYTAEQAIEIAKFDDVGNYRPLKTAPNLRHGWRILVPHLATIISVIDAIYPGRLAVWRAWRSGRLVPTPWRQTLARQSGIYRVAAKIPDAQTDDLIGNFCRSDGGCLRTILWKRDDSGARPSTRLPAEKFDPAYDQTGHGRRTAIPLLCQEPCNLLIAAARKAVKGES